MEDDANIVNVIINLNIVITNVDAVIMIINTIIISNIDIITTSIVTITVNIDSVIIRLSADRSLDELRIGQGGEGVQGHETLRPPDPLRRGRQVHRLRQRQPRQNLGVERRRFHRGRQRPEVREVKMGSWKLEGRRVRRGRLGASGLLLWNSPLRQAGQQDRLPTNRIARTLPRVQVGLVLLYGRTKNKIIVSSGRSY